MPHGNKLSQPVVVLLPHGNKLLQPVVEVKRKAISCETAFYIFS
jgi:hypothetical protein